MKSPSLGFEVAILLSMQMLAIKYVNKEFLYVPQGETLHWEGPREEIPRTLFYGERLKIRPIDEVIGTL